MPIDIDQIANQIVRELQRYERLITEEVEVAKETASKELVVDLKKEPTPKRTGSYRKGWRIKKKGNVNIIHNKTNYQLTHLLEKEHKKRGSSEMVQPTIHIAPAAEKAINNFTQDIERAIRQ